MQKGYYYDKRRDSYVVRHQKDGKRVHIGSFKTPEEATRAYLVYSSTQYQDAVMSDFVYQEKSVIWLKPFRELKAKLLHKRLEKKLSQLIERF